jgi:hypothetical protein
MTDMKPEGIFNLITVMIRDVYGRTVVDSGTSITSFNAVSEDNDAFLKRFRQEFNVDMTGFDYYDFFREDQFYTMAVWHLILKLFRKVRQKKSLTIDHLIKVVQDRRWSAPS